jgi:TonB family protein
MSIAAPALRLRPGRGPALRNAPLPLTATIVSAVLHASLLVGVILGARAWSQAQPKTYIVNLAPAIAAVGSPQGKASPTLPPRPDDLPRPAPSRPTELPQREESRPPALPELPARRAAPTLPDRDRTLPSRVAAAPRAGEKELPQMSSAAPKATTPEKTVSDTPSAAVAPPPAPLGRRDGSPGGSGAMTLNTASDFPFAWYLSRVQAKITERWAGKAIPGQQPIAVFEIARDGRVGAVSIARSSGNSYYDQAALRAITEANPFPPLPPEYGGTMLRVRLAFDFAERG